MVPIEAKQLEEPPRKVGEIVRANLGPKPVYQIRCKGGFWMMAAPKDGRLEPLGMGSHRGLARFNAEEYVAARTERLQWTELSKSDHVDPRAFGAAVEVWRRIGDHVRARLDAPWPPGLE